MTWTDERRAAQSARMKATRPADHRGRGLPSPVSPEDRRLIRALGDEREFLRDALRLEKARTEEAQAQIRRQLSAITCEEVADKFDVTPSQVRQIWEGTAGQTA